MRIATSRGPRWWRTDWCDEGRMGVTAEELRAWIYTLGADDAVALEATGHSDAMAVLIAPRVRRLVVADAIETIAIAMGKVKTEQVDARTLAQLWLWLRDVLALHAAAAIAAVIALRWRPATPATNAVPV